MSEKAKCKEAKEYLQQIKKLDVHIDSLLEQVAHLKAMSLKITTTLRQDVSSGSGSQDKIGDAIAKIIDLENEINQNIDEYVDKKREICAVIEKVENPDQAALLHKRYLLYEPWEQIAIELHCTYRNVCYIHGRALQAVATILEEKNDEADGC